MNSTRDVLPTYRAELDDPWRSSSDTWTEATSPMSEAALASEDVEGLARCPLGRRLRGGARNTSNAMFREDDSLLTVERALTDRAPHHTWPES